MKFKKDGKVYVDMVAGVYDCCDGLESCSECKLHKKTGGLLRSCLTYARLHPKEVARLLGYEVIEDDAPDTAETVEENSGNVKHRLTRADILHAAEKCVCGQREQDYGTPEDNFKAIAELWEAYLNKACTRGVNVCVEAKDVAVMMALLKIARIAAGGGKADSWIDLAGYAACGAECEGVTE